MKKAVKAVALMAILSGAAFAAPQDNTFYVGASAGWSAFHDGLKQFKEQGVKVDRNHVTYGVFGGYQITPNFAVELGYNDYGRAKGKKDGEHFKHTAHGTELTLKGSYPVIQGLDVYGRVGAALIRNDYKAKGVEKERFHSLATSAVFAAGVEYDLTDNLALRTEYRIVNNLGRPNQTDLEKMGVADYRPDAHAINLGITYRFGGAPAPAPAPMMKEPEMVKKDFSFSSDFLFDHNKSNLKAEGEKTVDGLTAEITKLNLDNQAILVTGFTDRTGSDQYNMKLSQRRAETVGNALVQRGVDANTITAQGAGEQKPVTGTACDHIKGRTALIACLAPDRRVEVSVTGSKKEMVQ